MRADGSATVRVRFQCAAMTNGCQSFLVFEAASGSDVMDLDREVPEDRHVGDLLRLNGWHINYGRWVCSLHEDTPMVTPPESPGCESHTPYPAGYVARSEWADLSGVIGDGDVRDSTGAIQFAVDVAFQSRQDEMPAYLTEAMRDPGFARAYLLAQSSGPLCIDGREYRRRQRARKRRRP